MERTDDIFAAFCEDLEGYVEGTLPDARRREMDAFLETSEEARALLAEFREADALFDDATWEVPPPRNLPTAQAILDAARPARSGNFLARLRPAWLRPAWVAALAGLLVVGGTTWVLLRSANQPKLDATAQRAPGIQEQKITEEQPVAALSSPASSAPMPPAAPPAAKSAPSAPKEAAPASTNDSAAVKNLPAGPAPSVSVGGVAARAAEPGAVMDGVSSQPAPPPPADSEAAKVVAKDKKADAETKTGEVVAVQAEGSATRANTMTVAKPATERRTENATGGAKAETPLPPRSVTLEISVADLTTARSRVTLFVQQSGGSVNVPLRVQEEHDADLLEIGARVPSDKALLVLKQLRGLGTVERETTVPSAPAKESRKTADAASSRDDAPAPSTLRVKLRRKK